MIIDLGFGQKFASPSKQQMDAEKIQFTKAFPPGVVINASNVPLPIAALARAGGRGILSVIKNQMKLLSAQCDVVLSAVRLQVKVLEGHLMIGRNLTIRAENKAIDALRKANQAVMDQVGQAMVGKDQIDIGYITAKAFRDSIPISSFCRVLEEQVRSKAKVLRAANVKVVKQYALVTEMYAIISWLEARKTYFVNWVNAIDVAIAVVDKEDING